MKQTIDDILAISDNRLIKILLIVLMALLAQIIIKAVLKSVMRFPLNEDIFPKQRRDREKRIKTLNGIVGAIVTLSVWFVAVVMILGILNVPIAPLLTSAGLIGAALAFGMQSLIRDFISGIFIISENQYRVDDYIQLEKVGGKVKAITVRTTVLEDENGSIHHIPNGSIIISTNLSMGALKLQEQLDIDPDETIAGFKSKLDKISAKIEKDPELSTLVKAGPTLVTVNKVTTKATTVTITFTTSANKRHAATGVIWQEIKQSTIKLA
jgi:small conductance mechanosensitive channel